MRFIISLVLLLALSSGAAAQDVDTIIERLLPKNQNGVIEGARDIRGLMEESSEAEDVAPAIDLHIVFAYNSAALEPAALTTLRRLGQALTDPRLAAYRFSVTGHTDATGSADFNQALSERRALAVSDFLVAMFDVEPDKLDVSGVGENDLLRPSEPESPENRRVRIVNLGNAP